MLHHQGRLSIASEWREAREELQVCIGVNNNSSRGEGVGGQERSSRKLLEPRPIIKKETSYDRSSH